MRGDLWAAFHQSRLTNDLSLLTFNRPRFPVFVNGDVSKDRLSDFGTSIADSATAPRLDSDRHRCSTHPDNGAVQADFIPDKNGFMEYHAVDGNGYTTATRTAAGGISCG